MIANFVMYLLAGIGLAFSLENIIKMIMNNIHRDHLVKYVFFYFLFIMCLGIIINV